MNCYDDRLSALQSLIDAMPHAKTVLDELQKQRQALEKKVLDLHYVQMSEKEDVDRLETVSLRSVILAILGKKEERLDQERAELAAAILKRDLAQKELDALDQLIAEKQQIFNRCANAEAEYEQVLREKAEHISVLGGYEAEQLDALRRRISSIEVQIIELSEALTEGKKAESIAQSALDSLGSAGNWGTLDLFCDSMLFDLAKYGAMDEAKDRISRLQMQLRRFRAELADVAMDANAEIDSGGMFRFADYFFDDIFTAISSMNRIDRAKDSVSNALIRIRETIRALEEQSRDAQIELDNARNHLRNVIKETRV